MSRNSESLFDVCDPDIYKKLNNDRSLIIGRSGRVTAGMYGLLKPLDVYDDFFEGTPLRNDEVLPAAKGKIILDIGSGMSSSHSEFNRQGIKRLSVDPFFCRDDLSKEVIVSMGIDKGINSISNSTIKANSFGTIASDFFEAFARGKVNGMYTYSALEFLKDWIRNPSDYFCGALPNALPELEEKVDLVTIGHFLLFRRDLERWQGADYTVRSIDSLLDFGGEIRIFPIIDYFGELYPRLDELFDKYSPRNGYQTRIVPTQYYNFKDSNSYLSIQDLGACFPNYTSRYLPIDLTAPVDVISYMTQLFRLFIEHADTEKGESNVSAILDEALNFFREASFDEENQHSSNSVGVEILDHEQEKAVNLDSPGDLFSRFHARNRITVFSAGNNLHACGIHATGHWQCVDIDLEKNLLSSKNFSAVRFKALQKFGYGSSNQEEIFLCYKAWFYRHLARMLLIKSDEDASLLNADILRGRAKSFAFMAHDAIEPVYDEIMQEGHNGIPIRSTIVNHYVNTLITIANFEDSRTYFLEAINVLHYEIDSKQQVEPRTFTNLARIYYLLISRNNVQFSSEELDFYAKQGIEFASKAIKLDPTGEMFPYIYLAKFNEREGNFALAYRAMSNAARIFKDNPKISSLHQKYKNLYEESIFGDGRYGTRENKKTSALLPGAMAYNVNSPSRFLLEFHKNGLAYLRRCTFSDDHSAIRSGENYPKINDLGLPQKNPCSASKAGIEYWSCEYEAHAKLACYSIKDPNEVIFVRLFDENKSFNGLANDTYIMTNCERFSNKNVIATSCMGENSELFNKKFVRQQELSSRLLSGSLWCSLYSAIPAAITDSMVRTSILSKKTASQLSMLFTFSMIFMTGSYSNVVSAMVSQVVLKKLGFNGEISRLLSSAIGYAASERENSTYSGFAMIFFGYLGSRIGLWLEKKAVNCVFPKRSQGLRK